MCLGKVRLKLVKSRQVAEIASEHFGVALLDLSCLDKESQPKGLVSEKLIRQHHVLPLWRRGNKLFVGISDPSNHQAITDIQFSTGLTTEAILVEDDKLADAIDKFFDSNANGLEDMGDVDLEGLDIESIDDKKKEKQERLGQDADDAPVVRFVNKMLLDAIKGGSSDLHFEPYEKVYRVRLRTDGILREVAQTTDPSRQSYRCAPESHGQHGYLRAPQTPGRANQDAYIEDQGHRLPGQHPADAVGRKDRDADPRPVPRSNGYWMTLDTNRIRKHSIWRP